MPPTAPDAPMDLAIRHDPAVGTFSVDVEGQHCVLQYALHAGVMKIVHTGVPEAVGGRGIAARLTRTALETARAAGWRVVPACAYAAAFVARHPEYADLLA